MAENSWHRYDMKKLRHCHPMYSISAYACARAFVQWNVMTYSVTRSLEPWQPIVLSTQNVVLDRLDIEMNVVRCIQAREKSLHSISVCQDTGVLWTMNCSDTLPPSSPRGRQRRRRRRVTAVHCSKFACMWIITQSLAIDYNDRSVTVHNSATIWRLCL